MADESAQLEEYNVQLQQVEAALTINPDDEDLNKLKKDLLEVITLTCELLGVTDAGTEPSQSTSAPESSAQASSTQHATETDNAPSAPTTLPVLDTALPPVLVNYRTGIKCLAPWSKDRKYYPALVKEVLENDKCTVTFLGYNQTEEKEVTELRQYDENYKRPGEAEGSSAVKKAKKDLLQKEREYKKAKSLKKAQKRKEVAELTEKDKNKWLDFNAKAFSKSNKGRVKKSIFATPDTVGGKVGVGTCGKAGKPMTAYSHTQALAKWMSKK